MKLTTCDTEAIHRPKYVTDNYVLFFCRLVPEVIQGEPEPVGLEIRGVSNNVCRITGRTASDLLGKSFKDLLSSYSGNHVALSNALKRLQTETCFDTRTRTLRTVLDDLTTGAIDDGDLASIIENVGSLMEGVAAQQIVYFTFAMEKADGMEEVQVASSIHFHDPDHVLIEIERRITDPNAAIFMTELLSYQYKLRHVSYTSPDDIVTGLFHEINALLKPDRCLAYKFLVDGDGIVINEAVSGDMAKVAGYNSFLQLRFPAGDIPLQARLLYVINRSRYIEDVDAPPVLLTMVDDNLQLDLTNCQCRGTSPTHLQYLRNLQLKGSASFSVVAGGKIAYMIMCQHLTTFRVPTTQKRICENMALLSSYAMDQYNMRERLKKLYEVDSIVNSMHLQIQEIDTPSRLRSRYEVYKEFLHKIIDFDGFQVYINNTQVYNDALPQPPRPPEPKRATFFHEAALAAELPEHADAATWGGYARFEIETRERVTLLLWRRVVPQSVSWAGVTNAQHSTTPRTSFAVVRQDTNDTSLPFAFPKHLIEVFQEKFPIFISRIEHAAEKVRMIHRLTVSENDYKRRVTEMNNLALAVLASGPSNEVKTLVMRIQNIVIDDESFTTGWVHVLSLVTNVQERIKKTLTEDHIILASVDSCRARVPEHLLEKALHIVLHRATACRRHSVWLKFKAHQNVWNTTHWHDFHHPDRVATWSNEPTQYTTPGIVLAIEDDGAGFPSGANLFASYPLEHAVRLIKKIDGAIVATCTGTSTIVYIVVPCELQQDIAEYETHGEKSPAILLIDHSRTRRNILESRVKRIHRNLGQKSFPRPPLHVATLEDSALLTTTLAEVSRNYDIRVIMVQVDDSADNDPSANASPIESLALITTSTHVVFISDSKTPCMAHFNPEYHSAMCRPIETLELERIIDTYA